jgi:predicted Fe-Mo cluster-binding NifX family protein
MQVIRAAIATDDGFNCNTRHFGDARFYEIYDIGENGAQFVSRLDNTVDLIEEESPHGDPRKASGIGGLLKQQQVNTAVSKVFGPNIKRLILQYACVITAADTIPEVLEILVREQSRIRAEIEQGAGRKPLDLRKLS